MDHAESTRIQYPARIAWNSRFLTLSRSGVTLESSFLPADNANFAVFAGRLREWREICCIRVVPSLALGLVWLLWVVTNRANFAVLAPDLGEMRGICLVRGQFLSSSDPGKTLFLCGLHEICVTRGYRWRMALNLLSSRAIPFICLQKTDSNNSEFKSE